MSTKIGYRAIPHSGYGRRLTPTLPALRGQCSCRNVVVARLGDRVKHWATHNEPCCVSILSHELGEHAPGLRDRKVALQVAHNVLVSHGAAVPVIRQHCLGGQVGIVLNFEPAYPATDSDADQVATRLHHATFNLWFLDPIAGRGYPQEAWDHYGAAVPQIQAGDPETIAAPLDFLGVNNYTRAVCHDPAGGDGQLFDAPLAGRHVPACHGHGQGGQFDPDGRGGTQQGGNLGRWQWGRRAGHLRALLLRREGDAGTRVTARRGWDHPQRFDGDCDRSGLDGHQAGLMRTLL